MVFKFAPELNKVYFINQHTMYHILEGTGGIQVDFKNYFDWADKLIFLEKGQYIKFLASNFVVRQVRFSDEVIFRNKDVRVLFKHLLSLGYINFLECDECQSYLNDTILTGPKNFVDISSDRWYWQNPFDANKEEYHLIFDIKDIIDKEYHNHLTSTELSKLISTDYNVAHSLVSEKVGITIKSLMGNKRLLESQRSVAFSDKPIKEIAYELGYKDPAYFNRIFKKNTGTTPVGFREQTNFEHQDYFLQELYELLSEFHKEHRSVGFYADRMHLTQKTLSRKVKEKLSTSVGKLIRQEILNTARRLLREGAPIQEVAFSLGFEEANHFSTFFKHYTTYTPGDFQRKKYNQ